MMVEERAAGWDRATCGTRRGADETGMARTQVESQDVSSASAPRPPAAAPAHRAAETAAAAERGSGGAWAGVQSSGAAGGEDPRGLPGTRARSRRTAGWLDQNLTQGQRVAAPVRLAIVSINFAVWLALPHAPGADPALVWDVNWLSWAFAIGYMVLIYRWPEAGARFATVGPLMDLALVVAWIAVTGGSHSPFVPLMFVGVVGLVQVTPTVALGALGVFTAAMVLTVGSPHVLAIFYLVACGLGLTRWTLRMRSQRWLADTDGLTELFNHRYMKERLAQEMAVATARGRSLALLFLDLDGFKLFNDTYGHPLGDRVLRAVAERLGHACPQTGVIGRFGGDEFVVILPDADPAAARAVGERIRAAVAEVDLRPDNRVSIPITVSVGIALYPDDAANEADLLAAADRAVYLAKRAGGGAVAMADARLHRGTETLGTTLGALQSLAVAVEYQDQNDASHTDYVSRLCVMTGERLGLTEEQKRQLQIGAVLHDVGKIGVPEQILLKPGPLSQREAQIMRQHPELGFLILKEVQGLETALDIVLHHHERYDGGGYPHGLAGQEIALPTKIVTLVDAFTAMTADRPYRNGLSRDEAIAEIRRLAGAQFDPEVVEAFVGLLGDMSVGDEGQ
jgi:diguanylate cyclase (GGDEF)-like protein